MDPVGDQRLDLTMFQGAILESRPELLMIEIKDKIFIATIGASIKMSSCFLTRRILVTAIKKKKSAM